jgi:hypothetical protein
MQKLIADIRATAHKERQINREATELQLYALQLCREVENILLPWLLFKAWVKRTFTDDEPMKDESHSKARYI